MSKYNVIIDSDPGVDDSAAIILSLDDDELDAVAGGKTGCNTAKGEALANQNLPCIVCPNCGAVGDWEYHGSGFNTRGYYCRKCKLQMYLSGDDDYSVLHTNGSIATIQ